MAGLLASLPFLGRLEHIMDNVSVQEPSFQNRDCWITRADAHHMAFDAVDAVRVMQL